MQVDPGRSGQSVPGYHLSILYKIIGRAIFLCKIIVCALYLYKLIVNQFIYIKVLAFAIILTKFPANTIYLYKSIEGTISIGRLYPSENGFINMDIHLDKQLSK
jgi:hypothetical protein